MQDNKEQEYVVYVITPNSNFNDVELRTCAKRINFGLSTISKHTCANAVEFAILLSGYCSLSDRINDVIFVNDAERAYARLHEINKAEMRNIIKELCEK